jgi:teichuronic acid biosynthesis glycosyltransferase TuaG
MLQIRKQKSKNTKPKVSVIVTSCNSEKSIIAAIESVRCQTTPEWEAIIVDDGSVDNTPRIIKYYKEKDPRFRAIILAQRSGGPAYGRNKGIAIASSGLVAFLDADDIWHPQKLEVQINQINELKCDFVSSIKTNFRKKPPKRFTEKISKYEIKHGRNITLNQLEKKNRICLSSVLCKKKLFSKVDFPAGKKFIAVEDYWCWLKIHSVIESSWLFYMPLVAYRESSNSISASKLYMAGRVWFLFGEYFARKPFATCRRLWAFASYTLISICLNIWSGTTLHVKKH